MKRLLIAAAIVSLALTGVADAQQLPPAATTSPTIKRTPLQKFDVPGTNYETVMALAEIVANANVGRHTHPGPETSYVVEGELTLLVEGQPPKPLKAGDSFSVPGGTIHDARTGPNGAKVLATYVVEKGKPLASPAP